MVAALGNVRVSKGTLVRFLTLSFLSKLWMMALYAAKVNTWFLSSSLGKHLDY